MRSIEEMQTSIKNIQCELQQLRSDLDDIRSEKNGGALNFDISEVSVKAKREPISPHPLSQKDEYTKRQYLILLLSVAQFEQDKLYDSLLFAHRIAYGCGYLTNGDLLDEYTSSHMLTFTQLDELVSLFSKDDLRLMLIEEMLLMAGIFEKGLKPAVDYISQMCRLLNVTNEEITYLSQIAAVILTGNQKLYTCGRNKYELFDCYLPKANDIHVIYADVQSILSEGTNSGINALLGIGMYKKRFSRCKSISVNGNIITYIIEYKNLDGFHDETTTQIVSNNFVLMANADDIQPNYPVGVVSDSMLVPIEPMRKLFREAVRNFENTD